MKKILVPGGTGAMGTYLVPELLRMGYKVDVVSLDDVESTDPNLRYFKANFIDAAVRAEFLKGDYDAIVDFMIYNKFNTPFRDVRDQFLENTGHYIYFSTYRIYANEEHPIKETSPRLLDVATDEKYLAAEDYSLYKARGEDLLHASGKKNWTIVRPAITFSKRRFQLVTMEANTIIPRARRNAITPIPEEALNIQATMSWAGDVGKMISRLVMNDAAKGEIYTLATAEHNTWADVAGYYRELIGLRTAAVPEEDYLDAWTCGKKSDAARWQLELDRFFDRIVDNTKILTVTGMKQSELMPVYDGLKRELAALPANVFADWSPAQDYMSAVMEKLGYR